MLPAVTNPVINAVAVAVVLHDVDVAERPDDRSGGGSWRMVMILSITADSLMGSVGFFDGGQSRD